MKDIQGMPGTPGGLALRLAQFVFAVTAIGVMVSYTDFTSVTAFRLSFLFLSLNFGRAISWNRHLCYLDGRLSRVFDYLVLS